MEIAIGLLIFGGVVLLLIGLVGGGFTFSTAIMPKVGKVGRVACFGMGSVLIVVALGLIALQISPISGSASASPATTTTGADAPSTGQDHATPSASAASTGPTQAPSPIYGSIYAGSYGTADTYTSSWPNNSSRVRSLSGGDQVEIECFTSGQPVSSPDDSWRSSIWLRTSAGYIAETWMSIDSSDASKISPCR